MASSNQKVVPNVLLVPGQGHHPFIKVANNGQGKVYPWRSSNIDLHSPVTVNELMRALGPAVARDTNKKSLRALLKSISAEVDVEDYSNSNSGKSSGPAKERIVSVKGEDDKTYDLSPSDVHAMAVLLHAVHDLGLDYKFVSMGQDGRDGIGIQLNDNSQAVLTLVNLQDPQRVGEVQTQSNVHWGPELTQMRYQAGDGKVYAIAQAYTTGRDQNGNMVPGAVSQDPIATSSGHNTKNGQKATRFYRYSNRRVQDFKPLVTKNSRFSVQPEDIEKSQTLARARYAALDQDTKNRLALAGLVNVLGVDPKTFGPQMAKWATTGQVQTINRLSNSKTLRFQGQVDMGHVNAQLGPVDLIDDQRHISQLGVPNSRFQSKYDNDFHGGKILLDLSSAFVGTGDNVIRHNPVLNPHVMDQAQADNEIVNAWQAARKNYLSRLTGGDQSQIDQDFGREQAKFRRLLSDTRKGLDPLDAVSQKDVLQAFSTALLRSKTIVDDSEAETASRTGDRDAVGIDDSEFAKQRTWLSDHVEDPVLRSRELAAFDNLTQMMDAKFGTGLVKNFGGYDRNAVDGLTLDEFESNLKDQIGNRSAEEQKQLLDSFASQKQDLLATLQEQFGDDYDEEIVNSLSLSQLHQLAHTSGDNELVTGVTAVDADGKLHHFASVAEAGKQLKTSANLTKHIEDGTPIKNSRSKLNGWTFAYEKVDNPAVQARMDKFDDAYHGMLNQPVKEQVLNVADVINYAQEGRQDHQYPFMMAQAVNKSRFRDLMMGDNTTASLMVMERSVAYDPSTAKTADELLEEDKHGHEAELQQYIADVKSGKKKFSWDPKENPEPGAFRADGKGLINPVSENQFKANALHLVEERLKHRGADPKHIDVRIDDQGIIHYKARIPLYNAVTHQKVTDGADYKRKADGSIDTTPSGTVRLANSADSDEVHYQPIEGSIGQVFAPSHDGLIRTHYARFGGMDPKEGQKTFLPNSRAWYIFPDTKPDGSFDIAKSTERMKNGFGINNYLRIQTYQMLFNRELTQSVDSQLSTRDIGDVTNYNDTTILGKLMHGETLGNEAPKTIVRQAPNETRQAILETLLRGVRFNDDVAEATSTSNVVKFTNRYQVTAARMRRQAEQEVQEAVKTYNRFNNLYRSGNYQNKEQENYVRQVFNQAINVINYHRGKLDASVYDGHKNVIDPQIMMNKQTGQLRVVGFRNNNYPDTIQVQSEMQDPLSYNGLHSIGEFAHMENVGYFSDIMTGQGDAFGRKRYLTNGAAVESSGRVRPNMVIFKHKPGESPYYRTADGKWVTADGGTPLGNLPFFEYAYKSAVDRISVGMEQASKAHELMHTRIANMALGSWTTEDAMVVSKDFAKKHQFMQDDGLVRFVKIGDKISDQAGNKATIAYVVDPDMDPKEAQAKHIADEVALFHDNPELEVVMNGMSQLSRNNAATTYMMLHNESSKPMKFRRRIYDSKGNLVDNSEVQTNATINDGRLILTDQTVDHKVTLYDQPGDKGRKSGALGAVSDASKGAPLVASYFRRSTKGLLDFRRHLLSQGLDLDGKGRFMPIDFDELQNQEGLTPFAYQINDQNAQTLDSVMTTYKGQDRVISAKPDGTFALGTWIANMGSDAPARRRLRFDGLDENGDLSNKSQAFIDAMTRSLQSRMKFSQSDDVTTAKGYSASRDFLSQLPTDGGVLQLPAGVTVDFHNGQDQPSNKLYILPLSQRRDTERMDGMSMASKFNSYYGVLGEKLAAYESIRRETIKAGLAGKDPKAQAAIDAQIAKSLRIQRTVDLITTEAQNQAFGGTNPKKSEFNENVMAGHVRDSVTSQVSANPNLPLDTVEVSPAIAKKLGFVVDKGERFAHMKGHKDWDLIHFHRDPIWREQGSLALRMVVNPEITDVRVSPIMFSLMDGDHDGDNVGLIAMKGNDVQKELHERCTVGQWLLDNNGTIDFHKASNLLNINAELVDQARRNNMSYSLVDKDGKPFIAQPFDHAKDQNGVQLPVAQDKALQAKWVDLMSHLRSDVLPDSVKGKEGKFDLQNAQKSVLNGDFNDSKILNMMVDNAIKQNYATGRLPHGFTKAENGQRAIRSVEAIVQTSRGFIVKQDTPTSDIKAGYTLNKSSLAGDGIDYTNEKTMIESLNRYVESGAKGKPSKYDEHGNLIKMGSIDGLLAYMNKPVVQELREAAKAQRNPDGTPNDEKIKEYRALKSKVSQQIIAVQRATKEKTDSTSVPGEIQKAIKNILMPFGIDGLHTSNRSGQGPTQRLLGIKRDAKEATKVVEYLQVMILERLLDGQRPKSTDLPTYSLVGDEREGLFGNDIIATSKRINTLHNYNFDFGNLFDQRVDVSRLNRKDLDKVAKVLEMDNVTKGMSDKEKDAFYRGFKETLSRATTPLIPEVVNGKRLLNHYEPKDENTPMTPKEFVNAMDYVYNDKLGIGVDRHDFEVLANALTRNGVIVSAKRALGMGDGFDSGVNSSLNADLQKNGIKVVHDQLEARANGKENEDGDIVGIIGSGEHASTRTVDSVFGKADSAVRKNFFAGMSDEELQQMMSLKPEVVEAAQPAVVGAQVDVAAASQSQMLGEFHDDFLADRTKAEDENVLASEVEFDDAGDFSDSQGSSLDEQEFGAVADGGSAQQLADEAARFAQQGRQRKQNTMRRRESMTEKSKDDVPKSHAPQSSAPKQLSSMAPSAAPSQASKSQTSDASPKATAASTTPSPKPKASVQTSIEKVKAEVQQGTFEAPIDLKLGGSQVVKAQNINQAVTWRYYEKAMMAGAKFDSQQISQAIKDNAANPYALQGIQMMLSSAAEPVLNGQPFLTSDDTRNFKKEAFIKQAAASGALRKAFNIKLPDSMAQPESQANQNQTPDSKPKKPQDDGMDL